jgi:hypothetical protein
MREPLTAESLDAFIKALGTVAKTASRIYLVDGASAIPFGWRTATIDIDLTKIERGHDQDLIDVKQFIESRLVQPRRLLGMFSTIEGQIHRYPALNTRTFRFSVEQIVREYAGGK